MVVLTEDEGKMAVRLARLSIEESIAGALNPGLFLTLVFDEQRGVFVTLTKQGELRGCIGFPTPVYPLEEAIVKAARAAATEDPRFPIVKPAELNEISIEVTILTLPQPLTCPPEDRPDNIKIGRHGLIVSGKRRHGLLLPQVATEYGWNDVEFLDHACIKAGLPPGCWQKKDVEILTFEGQIFHE